MNDFDAYEGVQNGIVVARHPDQVLPRYVVEFENPHARFCRFGFFHCTVQ